MYLTKLTYNEHVVIKRWWSAVVQVLSGSVCVVYCNDGLLLLAQVLSRYFAAFCLFFLPRPSLPLICFIFFFLFFSPLTKSVWRVLGRVGLMAGVRGFASNGVAHLGAGWPQGRPLDIPGTQPPLRKAVG